MTLFTAMGYASYIVWNNGGGSLPLTLYGVQLVLNLAWSPIFFKKKDIGFALLDITGKQSSSFTVCYLPYLGLSEYLPDTPVPLLESWVSDIQICVQICKQLLGKASQSHFYF